MRAIIGKGIRGAAVLLGVAVATSCFGDPVAPAADPIKPAVLAPPKEVPARPASATGDGVSRMEIYEGPNRTVYYFGSGASSSEKATLSELQRAENEMDYLNKLQTLRRLYVNNELTLQPQRLYVQEQLYGTQISYGQTSLMAGYGFGGYGMGGFNNYVNAYGPYTSSFYPYGGGFSGYLGGGSTNVVRSLAYGMGDEGVLKNNIAPVIAQQMGSPEYAQKVIHDYHTALADASASPRLARGLRLDGRRPGEGVPVEFGRDRPPVTLTLKSGDRVEGSTMKEEGDFYVVDTPRGQTSVRKSEVVRIDKAKTEK
jgi:hypothetical protein